MKNLTVKEYKQHFENTDHAEYIEKVSQNKKRYLNDQRKAILKKGKKSEKLLVKHGLVDEDGQLIIVQKSTIKKEVIKWFELMYS